MANKKQKIQWQPISRLDEFIMIIDGMLNNTIEQIRVTSPALEKPHVLDDYTVDRMIKLFEEQQSNLKLYEEQVKRWRNLKLSEEQQAGIEKLDKLVQQTIDKTKEALKLANTLSEGTIDKIMDMDPAQLAIETLPGKKKP